MLSKKIGTYLVEDQICDERTISGAIKLQSRLSKDGVYKPLGEIMIEGQDISQENLQRCLGHQRLDILSAASLFKDLPQESVCKIAEVAEHYVIPPNKTIFREGDPGDAFCIIISGSVRVFKVTEDGIESTLTTLHAGDVFGEMALLTGEPRSASVDTVEATSLLTVPKNAFDQVLTDNPLINKAFIKILSERLTKSDQCLAHASVTERAYQRFVSEQVTTIEPVLLGSSKTIRQLLVVIQEVAANQQPVFITGEVGTEKRAAAALLHQNSSQAENPLLLLDAKTVSMIVSKPGVKHRDPFHLELAQQSALFGHERGSFSFAKTRRMGLLEVCNEGTIVIENVEHLADSVQEKLVAFIKSGNFFTMGGQTKQKSSARIIVTSDTDLSALTAAGKFSQQLYELLSPQTITIPPLCKRKKDLRETVNHLIKLYSNRIGKPVSGIDDEAYNQIMSYNWPGNMDELDVVVRRAVNVAQSEVLTPEDLFFGLAPVQGKITFNLLRIDSVRDFMQKNFYPLVPRILTIAFLGLLLCSGFMGSQRADSNVSIVLVWGIWEPLLVLSWLFIARAFCAVCPMGALSDFINGCYSLRLKVPNFIRKYGIYLSTFGLGVIIWAEAVSSMHYSPRATAVMLIVISIGALVSGLLFQRRVWCRFLCPLGRLSGVMSSCSLLELRSNTSVCNTVCTTHSCYTGEKNLKGCPMYEAPFSLHSNQYCILCGNCIKICPHQSVKLNLRIPGNELWTIFKPDNAIMLFIPLVLATQLFRGLEETSLIHSLANAAFPQIFVMAVLMAVLTMLSYLYVWGVGILAYTQLKDSTCSKTALVAYALVPIAFTFELSYQLKPLLEQAGMLISIIGRQIGYDWTFLGARVGSGEIKTLQLLVILLGTAASMLLMSKLAVTNETEHRKHTIWLRRFSVVVIGGLYLLFFIAA
jgi:transcriptional regulator with AAA-type ATPase domain/polyferredoxin